MLGVMATLAASGATAQTARLAVLADSVSAGVPFEVAVTVTHGLGRQVTFPEVPPGAPEAGTLVFGDAEAINVRRLPPVERGGVRVDSAVYRAVVFAADSARVGPLSIRVTAPTDTVLAQTGSVLVPVRSVLTGETAPYEPAPIGEAEAFPSATPLWIGLGMLALLVLGGIGWALAKALRTPDERAVVLPYPAALARLDTLDREAPAEGAPAEAIEAHVVAVRDTLRAYLSGRLGVPAREATTREIADRLDGDARVPPEAAEAVRKALQPTDLVAFARVRPGPEPVARLRAATRRAIDAVEGAVRAQGETRGTGDGAPSPATASPPMPHPPSPSS
ncbi:hypothetical protein BSZ37_19960 [Rubrivirga marina]|uniref:Protein BatD n=1 Tax=Rubrivirga marina TaxID=1196024 RepID=A0A271J5K0_9BACT|nr:hypothetical protein BSZ37_19960 [Rubrivirga marina]